MPRTTGRRIALASVAGLGVLLVTFAWLGREHVPFALAFESLGWSEQRYGASAGRSGGPAAATEFRAEKSRMW